MVVCKFYLSGRCKFGDRCRNEHPRNISDFSSNSGSFSSSSNWQQGGGRSNYGGGGGGGYKGQGFQQNYNQGGGFGSSFRNQNRFAALGDDYQRNNRGPTSGAGDFGGGGANAEPRPAEILDSIKRDAEEWDASGMWPYSSFRPTRAQGDIPGLQDISPEELRLEAYLAEKENRFEEYKSAVSNSASLLQKKREMLKKPSGELQKALIAVYRGQHNSGSIAGKSIFGVQDISSTEIFSKSGSSLFQASNNPSNGFASSAPTGLFSTSATSGAFGRTQGSSFSANIASPSKVPQGLFSASSVNTSSFSSLSSQSSGFGTGGGTGFGTSGGTGFGTSGGTGFGGGGGFGSGGREGFGNSGSGLFGKPTESQAPTGLFGKPAQTGTGLFGKPATQGSGLFGKGEPQGTGLFGKGEPQGTGLFGKPATNDSPSVDSKCFTPLSELTPEEKEQFEAPSFTLGKIPTRPPPLEMVKTAA